MRPIFDLKDDYGASPDGLYHHGSQDIPHEFLDGLKAKRDSSVVTAVGEHMHVASLPVALVDRWMKQGFSIYDKNVTARDIVRRLKAEHLDGFLATNRAV